MIKEPRRDPDAILAQIKKQNRGKLTVFLGAAAGVGKTYAMLEAAHERQAEGFDVVVGWIDTHGRKETEALLPGLDIIPPRLVEYRGKVFRDMDLDAVLARRPQIALVDELAHTNIEGTRHPRRYLDVEELLEAGINVYTTFNIQHVESLNDTVTQITGVRVNETVPDRFLESADQIKLVDIPPEELVKRLQEGKVYMPEMAETAMRNFFRAGNINALRELALHHAALRVGQQMEDYRRQHGIEKTWPAGERVMACISSSPFSVHVLRRARQMADNLKTELITIYIEPHNLFNSHKARANLAKNLQLAEDLGAKVITMSSLDVASGVLSLAKQYNVSQIVLGKPLRPRWWELLHGSVVDEIIRGSTGFGVYIVPGDPIHQPAVSPEGRPPHGKGKSWSYLIALILVILVTIIGVLFGDYLGLANIGMLYLLPVLFISARLGLWPSVFASVASVLLYDFFLVPPVMRLTVSDARYLITFAVFMVVAVTTGSMADRLQFRMYDAVNRETRTKALYDLARGLSAVTDINLLAHKVVEHVAETMDAEVVLYIPEDNERLKVAAASKAFSELVLGPNELAVADWAFRHSHPSGSGTNTLPGAKGFYLPLRTNEKTLGVLGIKPMSHQLNPEQTDLLLALAGLSALAIGRLRLSMEAQEIKTFEESERLRTALFNSISHDMKTPLASILGASSSLLDEGEIYDGEQKNILLATIRDGALRMNRVVSNLLDMARLESGHMVLHRDWCDIEDIIGVTLRENNDILQRHEIKVNLPDPARLLKVDCALVEQVLTNLLHNAAKYSPAGKEILINVVEEESEMKVSVADRGEGIPTGSEEKIFDKFYRLQSPLNVSGTGLGLSICKGIIEAHGGRIWTENRSGGGTIISFSLPWESSEAIRTYPEKEGGVSVYGSTHPGN